MTLTGMTVYRATSATIACSLTASELEETESAWRKLARLSLLAREEIPDGVRLEFHPGSAAALRRLVDVERACCPWITFDLQGSLVSLTAPGPGATVIREMWSGLMTDR